MQADAHKSSIEISCLVIFAFLLFNLFSQLLNLFHLCFGFMFSLQNIKIQRPKKRQKQSYQYTSSYPTHYVFPNLFTSIRSIHRYAIRVKVTIRYADFAWKFLFASCRCHDLYLSLASCFSLASSCSS